MARHFIVAVDLGGTNLKVALLDIKYKILDLELLRTNRFTKKEKLISNIVASVTKIIKHNKLKKKDILGVGLGLPGPIDIERGLVHFFPNIPGWKEVNLKKILKKKLQLPIFLDNDANLMCLAEYKLGAAKGASNAVCLTLGTGVGGGIIIGKSLYRGGSFAAGELGHIPINEKGPRCNCGGKACLETYIGNNRILKSARILFGRDITLEKLSLLANKKNKKAKIFWSNIAEHLGIALVGVVNFLNPDCIVIGGGVANAGRVLFTKVREVIAKQAMTVQAKQVKVFKARLGEKAGLFGAAILVKEGI
jgi:glucokinase